MNHELFKTVLIWIFVLIFFAIACFKRRKIHILSSVAILISVTFFALLSPSGQVLLTIGSFRITDDALLLGLRRSGILIGMVFLSRIIISPNRNWTGNLGNKLTEVFYWLNLLTEEKISFRNGQIIKAIDDRLLEIWQFDLPE